MYNIGQGGVIVLQDQVDKDQFVNVVVFCIDSVGDLEEEVVEEEQCFQKGGDFFGDVQVFGNVCCGGEVEVGVVEVCQVICDKYDRYDVLLVFCCIC